jgi:hypothetical protein
MELFVLSRTGEDDSGELEELVVLDLDFDSARRWNSTFGEVECTGSFGLATASASPSPGTRNAASATRACPSLYTDLASD